jgi:hypothetical protein
MHTPAICGTMGRPREYHGMNGGQPQYMHDFERIYALLCHILCTLLVDGHMKINLNMNMHFAYLVLCNFPLLVTNRGLR